MKCCKECRWWGVHWAGTEYETGVCWKAQQSDSLLSAADDVLIYTKPTFGCVQWSPLGPDGPYHGEPYEEEL